MIRAIRMITVDEAIEIVLAHTPVMGAEQLPLSDALGRVLAEDIVSRREHPPWNNSAMDGYAVKWQDIQDTPATLRVVGEVQAGGMFLGGLNSGEAIQIMTGAPVPDGADTVVRVEDTGLSGQQVCIRVAPGQGANIRLCGEDIRLGETVMTAGTRCRPAEIGMLANANTVWASVYRRPLVSVLATGNELAEPGMIARPEQIVNSNGFSLAALVSEAGATPIMIPPARDEKADLEASLTEVFRADVGIVAGGVSVGKYDFVKDVLKDMGFEMKFWRVKMRPGHPVAFGVLFASDSHVNDRPRLLFGLPGNPVSCMVAFYQFVRPALRKMMGLEALHLLQVEAILEADIQSRSARRHFARAITSYRDGQYSVRLTGNQGSGILTSMTQANSFLILPEAQGAFQAGDKLQVQLLP